MFHSSVIKFTIHLVSGIDVTKFDYLRETLTLLLCNKKNKCDLYLLEYLKQKSKMLNHTNYSSHQA